MPATLPINKLKAASPDGPYDPDQDQAYVREAMNTDSVLAGLKAAQPKPAPYRPPMRNQAEVEYMVKELGLSPQMANGGTSQYDIEQVYRPQHQFEQDMTRQKISSPRDVAEITGRNQLASTEAAGRSHERVAGIEGESGLRRQQEVSRGALGVETERQSGKGSGYDLMRELMNGGMGGNKQPRSVSIPGVMSATFPTEAQSVSAPILKRLEDARNKVTQAWAGPFGGRQQAQQELDQLVGLAVPEGLMPAHIQEWIDGIVADPEYAGLSIDQIMEKSGQTDLDPLERAFANHRLMNRGR